MARMGTDAERFAAELHDAVEDDTQYGTTFDSQ